MGLMPNIFFLRKNLVSQNFDGWQNFVCLVLKQFFHKNLKSPKILLKNLDDPKQASFLPSSGEGNSFPTTCGVC